MADGARVLGIVPHYAMLLTPLLLYAAATTARERAAYSRAFHDFVYERVFEKKV